MGVLWKRLIRKSRTCVHKYLMLLDRTKGNKNKVIVTFLPTAGGGAGGGGKVTERCELLGIKRPLIPQETITLFLR